jgi:hypothetical protein
VEGSGFEIPVPRGYVIRFSGSPTITSKMRFLSRATMSFEVRATLRWREADSNFGSREDESIQEFQRLGPDPSLLRAPACALSLPGEI